MSDLLKVPDNINELGLPFILTGSRVICNPPVEDTDLDIVIDVSGMVYDEGIDHTISQFTNLGYRHTGSKNYGVGEFTTFRHEHINLILVFNNNLFDAWCYATKIAKELNITKKEDRVILFSIVKHYVKIKQGVI